MIGYKVRRNFITFSVLHSAVWLAVAMATAMTTTTFFCQFLRSSRNHHGIFQSFYLIVTHNHHYELNISSSIHILLIGSRENTACCHRIDTEGKWKPKATCLEYIRNPLRRSSEPMRSRYRATFFLQTMFNAETALQGRRKRQDATLPSAYGRTNACCR